MKTLLLLRHAKSSWKNEDIPDYNRPLSKRGQNDLPLMAEAIEKRLIIPQLVMYSTALRTAFTAQYMSQYFDVKHTLGNTDLYATNASAYELSISDIHDIIDVAMVVGHNPAIENLYMKYTGIQIDKFPTCACAAIRFDTDHWKNISEVQCFPLYFVVPNTLKDAEK